MSDRDVMPRSDDKTGKRNQISRRAILGAAAFALSFALGQSAGAQPRRRGPAFRRRPFRGPRRPPPGPPFAPPPRPPDGLPPGIPGPRPHLRHLRRRAIERFRQRGGPVAIEEVRAAIRRGDVQPLRRVYGIVTRRGGEVLDVDLFKRPGGWVYALRVLGPNGRVRDIVLNAKTLDLLQLD